MAAGPVAPPDFPADATRALKELERACSIEAGRTWNASLCGATLIVDPKTRRFVAQDFAQTDPNSGVLDPTVPIANTAVEWRGRKWAMIRWPLPEEQRERARLMLHESWHRVQPDLGLSAAEVSRDHLGTVQGRSSLRLEMRALSRAVIARSGAAMRGAACDALAVRFERYRRFTDAAVGEAALERNEGLAEYTGWVGAGPVDKAELAASLAAHERGDEFTRNFAYATGPAYGILLDRFRPRWRAPLDARVDLGAMLLPALGPKCATEKRYGQAASRFGMVSITAEESAIAERRAAREASWRGRLIDGAKATFPMTEANIVFNPDEVVALPPEGDVYPTAQVTARWGKLAVTDGLLLARDWSHVVVSGHQVQVSGSEVSGNGWTLSLAPGWQLTQLSADDWAIRVIFTPDMRSSRR